MSGGLFQGFHRQVHRALALFSLLLACRSNAEAQANACHLIDGNSGPKGTIAVRVDTVVDRLEVPWSIAFLPGGDFLVTERPGRLRLVRDGKLVESPVLTLEVTSPAEGGLLGLALAPDFARSSRFYLFYSVIKNGEPVNRVAHYQLSTDHASASDETIVFDDIPGSRYHDGGRIRFGPDGMLYVGTGDAQKPDRSQDLSSPNGKILRLTPEGKVPTDNPWPSNPAFVIGVRNVEAFDFAGGGSLYIADHGPSGELGRTGHDEINVAHRGDNLGWPVVYGCQAHASMVAPLISWTGAVPPGGGSIYTGDAIPEWKGNFIVGALGSKELVRVIFEGPSARHEVYFEGDPPTGYGRLRDVVMGPDRALYVTTSNCDGRGTCPPEKDKVLRLTR
jgi:glucose/arabinose dehydrogenase